MGWNQWMLLKVVNKTHEHSLKLKFPDPASHWGWTFKDAPNPQNTREALEISEIEKAVIGPQASYAFGQTGKQNEWAGMSGKVEVYTSNSAGGVADKICSITYSCPWAETSSRIFTIDSVRDQWDVTQWGANLNSGALGSITVEVRQL